MPDTCPLCGQRLLDGAPCPRCGVDGRRMMGELELPPVDAATLAAAGQLLQGTDERFEVQATLGRGRMGVVYKAYDRELDEVLALKVLDPSTDIPHAVAQFKQEIKIARRVNHPNVARVFDLVLWRQRLAITQEFIAGRSLGQVVADGPLSSAAILSLMKPICSALTTAHSLGVVHRDLKPANIIVDPKGQPRIVDFGLAFLTGVPRPEGKGYVIGTPWYMSPEQAFEPEKVDQRTDIYSLGVMLYYMASGRVPFDAPAARDVLFQHLRQQPPRLRELKPDASRAIEEVALRCLEKSPERRYQTAAELFQTLERLLTAETPQPVGVTPPVAVPHGKRGKVLVVDDDEEMRAWMRAVLAAAGCVVLEAEDGYAAMDAALAESPELIFLDILMPKLDGRETLRILKSNLRTAPIPVIMITSLTDEEEALVARETGAAAFLNKPVQRDVLELAVERFLPVSQD